VSDTPDLDALVEQATRAQELAYVPYSSFRVGAALLADDGRVFVGANIENAAYPVTICAERVALPAALMAGARTFTALAVIGDGPDPCTPCGMCRQVLFEFAPDLVVVAAGTDGSRRRFVLGADLLPAGFGPDRLRP
jgi:cytidine deaminase